MEWSVCSSTRWPNKSNDSRLRYDGAYRQAWILDHNQAVPVADCEKLLGPLRIFKARIGWQGSVLFIPLFVVGNYPGMRASYNGIRKSSVLLPHC
jgi:hypothetical protein